MFTGSGLVNPQLRMVPAAPVNRQNYLARRVVHIGDYVDDQSTHHPLTGAHGNARRMPGCFKIFGQSDQVRCDVVVAFSGVDLFKPLLK